MLQSKQKKCALRSKSNRDGKCCSKSNLETINMDGNDTTFGFSLTERRTEKRVDG